jgi:Tol biopolymer transport system component
VVEGAQTKENFGAAVFALAGNGSLVYLSGAGEAQAESTLVWVDRAGKEEPLGLSPREYFQAFVSPDGSRVATSIGAVGSLSLWVTDLARPALTPIPTRNIQPLGHVWTPDSRRLVFGVLAGGQTGASWTLADGTGAVERLVRVGKSGMVSPEGWAPDGETLVFTYGGAGSGLGIGTVTVTSPDDSERAWKPLIERGSDASMLSVSPDGRWIAYQSTAPGQYSVYVERFPELGGRELVSDEQGGWAPLWSRKGDELFYRRLGDGAMMTVPMRTSPKLVIGTPKVLFESRGYLPLATPQAGQPAERKYDVGPDGRFLMLKDSSTRGGATASLILIQNWSAELERLVPVD